MSRALRITIIVLALGLAVGLVLLSGLRERLAQLGRPQAEELARREVIQPPIATPTDVKVKAKILWAAAARDALAPVEIELPLSADPVLRAKQVIEALIVRPTEGRRTLPLDVTLLEFYLLPDGTAVADFSGALASSTPSGILSEQLAVDSIVQTLAANVPAVRRLKILIQGQEMDSVAGHVDLTGFFQLPPAAAGADTAKPAQGAPAPESPASKAPSNASPVKTR